MMGRLVHHNYPLQSAYIKYGKDNLKFTVLLYCDIKDLLMYEQLCIDSLKPEYNICQIAGRTSGYEHTDETKKKLSIIHKGKKLSDAQKEQIRISSTGRRQTKESIKKSADARRGKKLSPDACLNIKKSKQGKCSGVNNPMFGKKHSEETLLKIKISLATDEVRLKISAAHLGKPKSPESIRKMIATKLGRKEDPAITLKRANILREVWRKKKLLSDSHG